ncbi:MAG: Protein YciI [Candidatus Erwinia impunctatus]
MLYAIYAEDYPDSLAHRQQVRPAHVVRLQQLRDAGRLIIAGPLPAIESDEPGEAGYTGSVIIGEFPSLTDAERWAKDDPYLAAGVYRNVSVKPFKRTF